MLYLDARVRLDEPVSAGARLDQELNRPRIAIPGGMCQSNGVAQQRIAQRRVECRGRRNLKHLLVADLHRAVALPQMHDSASLISEHLDLDVARIDDQLLDQHRPGTECGLSLTGSTFERVGQGGRIVNPS